MNLTVAFHNWFANAPDKKVNHFSKQRWSNGDRGFDSPHR